MEIAIAAAAGDGDGGVDPLGGVDDVFTAVDGGVNLPAECEKVFGNGGSVAGQQRKQRGDENNADQCATRGKFMVRYRPSSESPDEARKAAMSDSTAAAVARHIIRRWAICVPSGS